MWECGPIVYSFGGVALASSRGSSNGSDIVDVTNVMLGFEFMNQVDLTVRFRRVDDGPASDLLLTVDAFSRKEEEAGQPPWGSASVKCSALNLRTLESAVIAALYRLDFQLAEREFERAGKPAAAAPGQ
jgi:hypothetical protein